MSASPTQHRSLAPGPSAHYEATFDESPTHERRGSSDPGKKRCSGEPTCDNCLAFHRECVFDETQDQRRRVAAKRTAGELLYYQDLLKDLLKVIRAEDPSYGQTLLEFIRRDASTDEIRAFVDAKLPHIGGVDEPYMFGIESAGPSFRPKVMDINYLCEELLYWVPAEPWTTVTTDSNLVSHLVSLYFTWDYPFHVFLDRDVFLKHMAEGDTKSEFCSPFLVNALLANACHFSDYSEAYEKPGDIMTKGGDFLAEAERLAEEEAQKLTLTYLQGTLMLHEKYSLAGKNDLGYKKLHQAIWIGESMGLIGPRKINLELGRTAQDMDVSLKRTAWGLFQIDTKIHAINLDRPGKLGTTSLWRPYPIVQTPRPGYLDQYFDKSCDLCEIARDMSQRLFAGGSDQISAEQRENTKAALYDRLCAWYQGLPVIFGDSQRAPPPYIIILVMRYYTLIITLLLHNVSSETLSAASQARLTPQSPSKPGDLPERDAEDLAQEAARGIARLARLHREEFGMSRAHHFAVYAINMALFVWVELGKAFDILEPDFLYLAGTFGNVASRSHIGRNLFHLFRQLVRSKHQGGRIRGSDRVTNELKALFDESSTEPSQFDEYAKGLEKLDEERYRAVAESHSLPDMLGLYESLRRGVGSRFVTAEVVRLWYPGCDIIPRQGHDRLLNSTGQNADGLSPSQGTLSQSSSDWVWRTGSGSLSSGNLPGMNYQLYPCTQYPGLNASHQTPLQLPQDMVAAPKIPIPRATTTKSSSQRQRSARACEPCRQRKVKCDGARPECRKCREQGMSCSYIDIKRIRDQKQLGVLSRKVERYEKLLRHLESDSDQITARRIKKALSPSSDGDGDYDIDDRGSDGDSSTSHGSLEDIDLVKEDLNRSEKAVAIGFFGKNSEVAWMQKLEDVSGQRARSESDGEKHHNRDIPIMSMSYHLDDLTIPFSDLVDPFATPPKEVADHYFNAYMQSVHPAFMVIRQSTFTSQYEQFFTKTFVNPPRKWLAVLNMIFALGCRFCKLTGESWMGGPYTDDIEFLNRTRKLCLSGNVLFDHDDLQQIQVELLVAFYLVALGQVNSASKFSSMALRSAISLGINLRIQDDRTHFASKEARGRLWWSIYLLEHLLTSITGRISGCGEGLSAALLPVPFDERASSRDQELHSIIRDKSLQTSHLHLTIYQNDEESQAAAAWLSKCEPNPTLLFHCLADLGAISQTVINSVYSVQGLRKSPDRLEQHLQKYSKSMDVWLQKVPEAYRFTLSSDDNTYSVPQNAGYIRERITLAIYYFSARITLCRPCLSHISCSTKRGREHRSRSSFRAMMTVTCLRASCSLLSILPNRPDTVWLTSVTPWWAILHFIMQATTALLIGLSTSPTSDSDVDMEDEPGLPSLTREMMVKETRKAFRWIHHLALSSRTARRAFLICESFLGRMGHTLGLDISDLPSSESLPPQVEDVEMGEDGLAMVDDGPGVQ
ncbi:transcription factor domain-containing protein [Aspergillus lucknowensis]|uniref:Fungal-specific transcription factor domain-containing protein n=1 Tax=Aspergillus lucknowensis TaxID=176173 RepID=A0ABR4LK66_9EURO